MSMRVNAYATVWETREHNGFIEARMSTRRKVKDSDDYVQDWSDWVTLAGDARRIAELPARSRIKVGDFAVTNKYDKEKGKLYTNYTMYSFEEAAPRNAASKPAAPAAGVHEDELPF